MGFTPTECAEFYQKQGYYVYENALSLAEVEELRAETTRICRGGAGLVRGLEVADDVALEIDTEDLLRRYVCIHFPHKISPIMHNYLGHTHMVDVLTSVIGPNVKCMQSMLFIKAAGKPGQAWHQDEYFIPTRDRSLIGGWIALDDATVENGCLWVIPGSHKQGIIWPTHYQQDARFDCAEEAFSFPYKDEDAIPVEVKAGTIVFFNGYLLHRSLPNRAAGGFRRALVNHYMSAESLLPWMAHRAGEPPGRADHRDIVMVAGKDPYAFKGLINVMEAHVRGDKKGGCGNQEQNLISTGIAAFERSQQPAGNGEMGGAAMGSGEMGGSAMGGSAMGGSAMGGSAMGGSAMGGPVITLPTRSKSLTELLMEEDDDE